MCLTVGKFVVVELYVVGMFSDSTVECDIDGVCCFLLRIWDCCFFMFDSYLDVFRVVGAG